MESCATTSDCARARLLRLNPSARCVDCQRSLGRRWSSPASARQRDVKRRWRPRSNVIKARRWRRRRRSDEQSTNIQRAKAADRVAAANWARARDMMHPMRALAEKKIGCSREKSVALSFSCAQSPPPSACGRRILILISDERRRDGRCPRCFRRSLSSSSIAEPHYAAMAVAAAAAKIAALRSSPCCCGFLMANGDDAKTAPLEGGRRQEPPPPPPNASANSLFASIFIGSLRSDGCKRSSMSVVPLLVVAPRSPPSLGESTAAYFDISLESDNCERARAE